MAREKIKKHHNLGEHIWEPMKEYQMSQEDFEIWEEDIIETRVGILKKMQSNEYLPVAILPARETNTQPFFNYIERLREQGLNIDKSDTVEYGYKMPEAEKGKQFRELRIFRREIVKEERIFRRK